MGGIVMAIICERCGKKTGATSMSYLNTETLCMDCKKEERSHPLYKLGKDVELAEVQKGNMNFSGILHGLEGKPNQINLMARIKFSDNPENIARDFSDMISYFSFKGDELANVFTTNGIDFVDECKSWVYYMANTDRVDGRNLEAQVRCKELNLPEQPLLPVAKCMARDHRTIQQSYTSFVLAYLLETNNNLPFV
jgi:hypothetical protein